MNSLIHDLADFVVGTSLDELPASVLHESWRLAFDTVGVALGASGYPEARVLSDQVTGWGGAPEASLWEPGIRQAPAVNVAYVNAYLSNLLDADETILNFGHIANCIVPTVIAVGERVGASGREVLGALALGFEVAARIGAAHRTWRFVDGAPEWSPVTGYSWNVFGVAAATGWLIRLSSEQMAAALGIAAYSAPVSSIGMWVNSNPLPNTKYVFVSPLVHAGIAAAFLAGDGLTGDTNALDGEQGFWRAAGSASFDPDSVRKGLGTSWLINEVSYKPYPACRFLHGALDSLHELLVHEKLVPGEIHKVDVLLPPAAQKRYFRDTSPRDVVSGSFSAPHTVACMINGVPVGPRWHTAETLADPQVDRIRKLVDVDVEPTAGASIEEDLAKQPGANYYRRCPSGVRVEARGKTFEGVTSYALGDPWTSETYFSDEDIQRKFARYSSHVLDEQRVAEWIEAFSQLKDVEDIRSWPVFV